MSPDMKLTELTAQAVAIRRMAPFGVCPPVASDSGRGRVPGRVCGEHRFFSSLAPTLLNKTLSQQLTGSRCSTCSPWYERYRRQGLR